MTRALAAVLALSAGLTAAPALAQSYQPTYPNGGYAPNSQYSQPAQSQYDRDDDRRYQDRDQRSDRDDDRRSDDRRYEDRRYDDQRGAAPAYGERRTETSPTYPDRYRGDRKYQDDPRSIDPAPGENRPYVGHPGSFYTVEQRLDRIEGRLAGLTASQRRRAYAEMRSIRAEERTQRGKHGGELRDWDREHLNKRLDALVRRYPGLGR